MSAQRCVAGILVSCSLSALAEPLELAANSPDTVIVTATRSERKLDAIPASVSVVSETAIQATPAQSMDDVLRSVPSLNLPFSAGYEQHPTANGISMRGLGTASDIRTLVLLDGVPMNHPFSGFVQWMRVPNAAVERVEIVRGGGSSLWGNYALGGVVNIITRAPTRTEFDADVAYGSRDTKRVNVYGANADNDALQLSANANWFDTDGYDCVPPSLRAPLDIPVEFSAKNVGVTANFTIDPTLHGYARVNYHRNDQTLGTPLQTNHQEEWDFSGSVTKALDDATDLTTTLFHTDGKFHTNNTATPSGFADRYAEYIQNAHDTPVKDNGLSLQWTTKINEQIPLLSFGGDYHGIKGKDVAAIFDESGAKIRTDVGSGQQQLIGVFGQISVVPISALEILVSAREERWKNFDGFDGNPGGIGNVPDKTESAFSPRVSLRYALTPDFALRAAAYKAFRAPNMDSLYRGFSTSEGTFLPNSQLNPEKLRGYEFGFDVIYAHIRSQVTLFDNRIDDLITSRALTAAELPPGFFYGSRNINAGDSRSRGLEAETTWQIDAAWSMVFGYTYTQSEILSNPEDPEVENKQLAGVPKNRVNLALDYVAANGVKVDLRGRWVQKTYGDNAHTLPQDGHTIVDASLSVPVYKNTEAYLSVENIFDRQYIADNSGFNPPQLGTPRTAMVGVRMKMD